jgi:DNA-binding transcriptional LysR family regulator
VLFDISAALALDDPPRNSRLLCFDGNVDLVTVRHGFLGLLGMLASLAACQRGRVLRSLKAFFGEPQSPTNLGLLRILVMWTLVRRGAAVGFFPRTYVAEDLARKDLQQLTVADLEPLQRKLVLVTRARPEPLSHAAQDLVSAIRGQAASLGLSAGRHERRVKRR